VYTRGETETSIYSFTKSWCKWHW